MPVPLLDGQWPGPQRSHPWNKIHSELVRRQRQELRSQFQTDLHPKTTSEPYGLWRLRTTRLTGLSDGGKNVLLPELV